MKNTNSTLVNLSKEIKSIERKLQRKELEYKKERIKFLEKNITLNSCKMYAKSDFDYDRELCIALMKKYGIKDFYLVESFYGGFRYVKKNNINVVKSVVDRVSTVVAFFRSEPLFLGIECPILGSNTYRSFKDIKADLLTLKLSGLL